MCVPEGGNILINGGFETGSYFPWYENGDDPDTSGSVASLGAFGNLAFSSESIHAPNENDITFRRLSQDNVKFCPGETYAISFDYRIADGNCDLYFDLITRRGALSAFPVIVDNPPGEWQSGSVGFTAPIEESTFSITTRCDPRPGGGTVYVDNIPLEYLPPI